MTLYPEGERVGRESGERERSSIIVQTLAVQSTGRARQDRQGALGFGCAFKMSMKIR